MSMNFVIALIIHPSRLGALVVDMLYPVGSADKYGTDRERLRRNSIRNHE